MKPDESEVDALRVAVGEHRGGRKGDLDLDPRIGRQSQRRPKSKVLKPEKSVNKSFYITFLTLITL